MTSEQIELLKKLTTSKNYSQLARAMGITPQRLNYLRKGGAVSPKLALRIELLTNGEIKRHDLLPDLFAGYQPNAGRPAVAV